MKHIIGDMNDGQCGLFVSEEACKGSGFVPVGEIELDVKPIKKVVHKEVAWSSAEMRSLSYTLGIDEEAFNIKVTYDIKE